MVLDFGSSLFKPNKDEGEVLRQKVIFISGVDFKQQEIDSLNESLYDESEGRMYFRKTTGAIAGVFMPDGATIFKIKFFGSNLGNCYLTRKTLPYSDFNSIATRAGEGSVNANNLYATVDNQNFAYFLTIYGTNDVSIIDGVLIEYNP